MRPDRQRLENLLDQAEADLKAIRETLDVAEEAQWLRSPVKGENVKVRSNHPGDPTGDTVIDPRRLKLRQSVKAADGNLLKASALLKGTRAALERGLRAWEG